MVSWVEEPETSELCPELIVSIMFNLCLMEHSNVRHQQHMDSRPNVPFLDEIISLHAISNYRIYSPVWFYSFPWYEGNTVQSQTPTEQEAQQEEITQKFPEWSDRWVLL